MRHKIPEQALFKVCLDTQGICFGDWRSFQYTETTTAHR